MGFFDKLKGAVNFVTGGAAKVVIEYHPPLNFPGEPVQVRVTVTSTGPAIQATGVYVDVQANEQLSIGANVLGNNNPHISHTKQTYNHAFQIAGAFQLGPNESKMFEGHFVLPANAQPTYDGPLADHDWGMRGRVEMSGNDPDSGFVKFLVGRRA